MKNFLSNSKSSATKDFAVDDKCIFKVNNHKDLAKKIDYFIENSKEKKLYEELYIEKSKQFNQENCMRKMVEMFEYVLTNK